MSYPSHPPPTGHYPPGYGYPYPPPRRDNGRGVAVGIAVVVLLVVGGAVYYGYTIASKEAAIQQQAQQVAGTYAQAANLYQAGQFAQAAPFFQKVRENPNASVDMVMKAASGESYCYRMLGQRAQEVNDLATAEHWFLQAVRVSPNDPGPKAELQAVQRARAILKGNASPQTNATGAGGSNPMPGFDPSKELPEDVKKAKDAQERLERGNVLFSQGNLGGACREWHDAYLTAPNSPAGSEAAAQRRSHCPPLM